MPSSPAGSAAGFHLRIRLGWFVALLTTFSAQAQSGLPSIDTTKFLPQIRAQVEEAERVARTHPDDAKSAGALAMTLHAYRQYEAAARVYARAHLLEPGNFDWPYLLGMVQMELGEFKAAVASFQLALDLAPATLTAELGLAQAETALGDLPEAAAVYSRILQRPVESARAWYGLGRVQSAMGDRTAAAHSYAKACDLFPMYGAAHFALAQELRRSGQVAEARQHLQAHDANATVEPPLEDPVLQRVSVFNRGAQAHMQRAAEFERTGRLDEAVREEEAALTADPDNVQAHTNLIALYGRTGNAQKAREHFEAAVRLSPGRSDAWYNYGILLLRERQDIAAAERAFRRAVEINPQQAEAHDNLGVIYEAQGRLDDAVREFRDAVASRPDYPPARFHLGRMLANQEKYDDAIQQFLRALEPESERTPTYTYALAATFARAGRREEARRYFGQALAAARARGQSQLADGIERDLKTLGGVR